MHIFSLFLFVFVAFVNADLVQHRPSDAADAPYSHRRLYGIRRLKVLRPIGGQYEVHHIKDIRRQPTTDQANAFVPRAMVPPALVVPPSRRIEGGSSSSEVDSDEGPATTRVVVQRPSQFTDLDESRRKRIEARWKRLGINFSAINYPHRNMSPLRDNSHSIDSSPIQQLNLPSKAVIERNVQPRPRIQGPILRVISPQEGEKPSPLPFPEDPNLSPFMNSARAKFGYGIPQPLPNIPNLAVEPPPPPPQSPPPPPPPPQPSPTTTTPTTTTPTTTTTPSTTTTEAPIVEETGDSGFGGGDTGDSGNGFGFGPSELPPEFANVGFGLGGGDSGFNFNVPAAEIESTTTAAATTTTTIPRRVVQRKPANANIDKDDPVVIPQNSGLRPVAPPKEFNGAGGFGSGFGGGSGSFGPSGSFGGGGAGFGGGGDDPDFGGGNPEAGPSEGDLFTGDSALQPSRGPTGDGYGPAVFPGGNAPPPVPAVGLGGAAAGKSPYGPVVDVTENPQTTVKPSALLSVLSKADLGFNQAIDHFEHGTPVETAAIDILEVALGSQKLDSQAKLLGHVDRTIGLDNLQRIQRWANTAGALDVFKEQFLKFAKNFQPPADLLPTVPPQLEYLFKTSGR